MFKNAQHIFHLLPPLVFILWFFSWHITGTGFFPSIINILSMLALILGMNISTITYKHFKTQSWYTQYMLSGLCVCSFIASLLIPLISISLISQIFFIFIGLFMGMTFLPILEIFYHFTPAKGVGLGVGIGLSFFQLIISSFFFIYTVFATQASVFFYITAFYALMLGINFYFIKGIKFQSFTQNSSKELAPFSFLPFLLLTCCFFIFYIFHNHFLQSSFNIDSYKNSYFTLVIFLCPLVIGFLLACTKHVIFFLSILALYIQTPLLYFISENTFLFYIVRSIDIFALFAIQMQLILAYKALAPHLKQYEFWLAFPYMFMLFASIFTLFENHNSLLATHIQITISLFFLTLTIIFIPLCNKQVLEKITALLRGEKEEAVFPNIPQIILEKNTQEKRIDTISFSQKYHLSKREGEILNLLPLGFSNLEMASKLFISENTLKTHLSNIFQKTKTRNRNQLLALLIETKD